MLVVRVLTSAHMWRSEGKSKVSVLSFHSMVPGNWTWLARLGCKYLYTSSHLSGLTSFGLQLVSDDE